MLVLTRKEKQTIRVGNDVTIRIERLGRHKVVVGIDAPEDVRILRGELVDERRERAA